MQNLYFRSPTYLQEAILGNHNQTIDGREVCEFLRTISFTDNLHVTTSIYSPVVANITYLHICNLSDLTDMYFGSKLLYYSNLWEYVLMRRTIF